MGFSSQQDWLKVQYVVILDSLIKCLHGQKTRIKPEKIMEVANVLKMHKAI